MQTLSYIFKEIDALFESCDIDHRELQSKKVDATLFDDYANQRIVNSFLFNFMKIQDKIGAKLFRSVLFELKEIEDDEVPMRDLLNRLEKLHIIEKAEQWDRLREIRNAIAHEYPLDIQERLENIALALEGYRELKKLYLALKKRVGLLTPEEK